VKQLENFTFILKILSAFVVSFAALPIILAANENNEPVITGHFRGQYRETPARDGDIENLMAATRINLRVPIDSAGCIKANARITSGNGFNSEDVYTGIGDNPSSVKMQMRHMNGEVDLDCYLSDGSEKSDNRHKLEVGALPIVNEWGLGPSINGWIDGIRFTIEEKSTRRRWSFSLGSIDDLDQPHFFDRNVGNVNHAEVIVTQSFGPEKSPHTFMISVAEFEDSLYLRSGIKLAIAEYVKYLKTISSEVLVVDGDRVGTFQEVAGQVGNVRMRVFRTDLDLQSNQSPSDAIRFIKYYYGLGTNHYAEATWDFSFSNSPGGQRNNSLQLRVRFPGDEKSAIFLSYTRRFSTQ
jgi:hypothetical protein